MKVTNYSLAWVYDNSFTDGAAMLDDAIKVWIGRGWQPYGSVSIGTTANKFYFAQAMVLYEQE